MTKYFPFRQFVIRTPLNSILELTCKNLNLDFFSKKLGFLQAIQLASPDLYREFKKYQEYGLSSKKEEEHLLFSMLKYYSRSCTRCTPFGLFAGLTIGTVSEKNSIILNNIEHFKPHTRLDMNYLCALIQNLEKDLEIRSQLTYYVNNSLYEVGDKIRYIEYSYYKSNRKHQISATENNLYLAKILDIAKTGAKLSDMAKVLVNEDICIREAEDYINQLIDNQVLVSDLEPTVTGDELHNFLMKKLQNLTHKSNQIKEVLGNVQQQLSLIDNLPLGSVKNPYSEVTKSLKSLSTSFDEKFLYQTDLVTSFKENQISEALLNNVRDGINIINKLSVKIQETNLSKFKDAFYKRYEDREIPLIQALDTESGIGYLQNNLGLAGDNTPLVDDLVLPKYQNQSQVRKIYWYKKQSLLLNKYFEASKQNKTVIEISDDDLKDFEENWDDLPSTISAIIKIVRLGGKNFVLMGSAGGSSAINLLGRFAHADKTLDSFISTIALKEEELNPNKILAEIVHLPESRIGNILSRPVFRKYEIPYLAQPSVPLENQIPLNDILISIKDNRIIIRSKKLQKEIKPHLSNAHNFSSNALPAYQFLADMQVQDLRNGIGFGWGNLDNEFLFFPRVTYKNIILSEAKWIIKKDDVKEVLDLTEDEAIVVAFDNFKTKHMLTNKVVLVDGDNELYIDLNDLIYVKMLLSIVKKRHSFTLKEFLFTEDALVKDVNGNPYTNQFIFSFYKQEVNND